MRAVYCYRYERKLSSDNAKMLKCSWGCPKANIYCELELNWRIKPRKRLKRGKPEPPLYRKP